MLPPIHQPRSHSSSAGAIDVIEPVATTAAGASRPPAASATPEVAARPTRTIDKLASYAITGVAVLAAIAVVIPVAFIGVPIGSWVLHSVGLAVLLGAVTLVLVAGVLTLLAKLIGIHAQPFGPEKTATPAENSGRR